MELIVISETKLKVMLTQMDMENYELDFDSLDYDNSHTRHAIWHLFDEVKRRCGFDAASERVMVQVYPGGDGGCELFVTKMTGVPTAPGTKRQGVTLRYRKCLYSFDTLSCLMRVCTALNGRRYNRPSDVYAGDDGKWYLVLEQGGEGRAIDEFSFVEEYGQLRRAATEMPMVEEHARPVVLGNAVKRMASLA